MASFVGVQVLDGVAQGGARHGGGVGIQEGPQPADVAFARLADPAPDGGLDEVLGVVDEELTDREGVVELPTLDEGPGGDDGRTPFPHRLGTRELVQRLAGLVE